MKKSTCEFDCRQSPGRAKEHGCKSTRRRRGRPSSISERNTPGPREAQKHRRGRWFGCSSARRELETGFSSASSGPRHIPRLPCRNLAKRPAPRKVIVSAGVHAPAWSSARVQPSGRRLIGLGQAASREGPVKEVESKSDVMVAEPRFCRELQDRESLDLVCIPRRRIEIISAPTLGIDRHLLRALTVGIGVEIGVADDRGQNHSGIELVGIRKSQATLRGGENSRKRTAG